MQATVLQSRQYSNTRERGEPSQWSNLYLCGSDNRGQISTSRRSSFLFRHPRQALLNSTPQLLARDRRAIAEVDAEKTRDAFGCCDRQYSTRLASHPGVAHAMYLVFRIFPPKSGVVEP
jgi:hypothetical protein